MRHPAVAALARRVPRGSRVVNLSRALPLAAALAAGTATRAAGQTDYYNLDAGRPTRVEDAVPTSRHELEIQLAPLRVERFTGGGSRWRLEPKLSFGVLPLTEVEIRAPVMHVRPSGNQFTSTGIASLGIGAAHALNVETTYLPGVALSGELLLPVGSLAATRTSYGMKLLATKTFSMVRVHLNASAGTYALRRVRAAPPPPGCGTPGGDPCPEPPPPPPPDLPCALIPADAAGASMTPPSLVVARCGPGSGPTGAGAPAPATTSNVQLVNDPTRSGGGRWMAGVGLDRALPLQSILFTADIVAERFVGLYDLLDWTAEVGIRRQLGTQLVLDLGVGRHFAGSVQSTSVTAGVSYGVPLRLLMRRGRGTDQ